MLGIHFYSEIVVPKPGVFYTNLLQSKKSMQTYKVSSVKIADKIFVNSEFTKQVLELYANRAPDAVVFPPIDPRKVIAPKGERKYVTMINPSVGKGMGRLFYIARKLPNINFLLVGNLVDKGAVNMSFYNKCKALRNVTVIPFDEDVRTIYEKTRVLLVPSIVDESFSMVTLEAFFNGIPVVSSNQGNLQFLNRRENCVSGDNIEKYVLKISRLMNDDAHYESESLEAEKIAQNYNLKEQCDKFVSLLQDLPVREETFFTKTSNSLKGVFLHYEPAIGGTEISMKKVFADLQKRVDNDIEIFCFNDKNGRGFSANTSSSQNGVVVKQMSTPINNIHPFIRNSKYVFTALQPIAKVAEMKKDSIFKMVSFVTDSYCYDKPPIIEGLKESDYVISNSEHTSRCLKEIGIDSLVLYPSIQYTKVPDKERKYVLFSDPRTHKGYEMVQALIKFFVNVPFVIIGDLGIDSNTQRPVKAMLNNNVEYLGKITDVNKLNEIYKGAVLTLVPSQVKETFGMVAAESIMNNTPVMVSGIGALPETANGCGIVVPDYSKPIAWLNAFQQFLDDPNKEWPFAEQQKKIVEMSDVNRLIEYIDLK